MSSAVPRLWLNVVFHTERLDDDAVFRDMVAFCRSFRDLTGVVPWLCVMTPECLEVRLRLQAAGFTAEAYAERILTLATMAEIGFHGHCFTAAGAPMGQAVFQLAAAIPQLSRELAWLAGIGIRPRLYSGGWWVINPDLLGWLGQQGFQLDMSTRGGLADGFGTPCPGIVMPVGERFCPVEPIVQIGSLPYITVPWPRYLADMQRHLPDWGLRPLWAALPLHDWDRADAQGHDLRIIDRLAASPHVGWLTPEAALAP